MLPDGLTEVHFGSGMQELSHSVLTMAQAALMRRLAVGDSGALSSRTCRFVAGLKVFVGGKVFFQH